MIGILGQAQLGGTFQLAATGETEIVTYPLRCITVVAKTLLSSEVVTEPECGCS